MTILIIGSEGFIGTNAVQYFTARGYQVVGCDIVYTPAFRNYKYLKVDAFSLDYSNIFYNYKFDFCLNAAGSANVGFSFENPELDFNSNVYAVHKILNAIRQYNPGCKLITVSSAAVYGNPRQLPVSEASQPQPVSPYGWHKLQAEQLCKEYFQIYGVQNCSLRIFSAFGPYLRKQLFWDLYTRASAQPEIEMFGTGDETRDFIFVDDILQAVECVMEGAHFDAGVINVANGEEVRISQAVAAFYNILSPGKQYFFNGQVRVGDPLQWRADISYLKQLGYRQRVSFDQGLEKYVKWLREDLK